METQTLYAEFLELLMVLEANRTIGRASGCFVTKVLKGTIYYYFQYSDPGGIHRQAYVGRKDRVLDRMVEKYRKERAALAADVDGVQRLNALLRLGGALVTDAASARVLKSLAESGVFHLNGVLVGTHAFQVLGNLLGVRWERAALKTNDIDVAGEAKLGIAIEPTRADVPKVLENLEMGFLPVPPLNPKNPSTSFKVRGQPLRVDLLTPARSRNDSKPVFIPRFNAAAQPLPFLDFLIQDPERGAVVNGGGVLVNVPNPARFAFHKLITSRERSVAMHDKTEKDLAQAAQVFSLLADERPGDILLAWDEIRRRGKGWLARVSSGLSLMKKKDADAHARLSALLKR
jgi:hypothetical protein